MRPLRVVISIVALIGVVGVAAILTSRYFLTKESDVLEVEDVTCVLMARKKGVYLAAVLHNYFAARKWGLFLAESAKHTLGAKNRCYKRKRVTELNQSLFFCTR